MALTTKRTRIRLFKKLFRKQKLWLSPIFCNVFLGVHICICEISVQFLTLKCPTWLLLEKNISVQSTVWGVLNFCDICRVSQCPVWIILRIILFINQKCAKTCRHRKSLYPTVQHVRDALCNPVRSFSQKSRLVWAVRSNNCSVSLSLI